MKNISRPLLTAISALLPISSFAQSSDSNGRVPETLRAANEAAVTGSARRSKGSVEEIIVTASRREERLQDVPIAISVVTDVDIDRRALVSAGDYLRGIPGVNQTEPSLFGQSIQIRGIETNNLNQNSFAGPTVATYVGETPTTTAAGLAGGSNIDVKVIDVERVEVLRGPQGTAFGSSSLGGAVRTIPVPPDVKQSTGKLAAGYSNTSETGSDNYNFQAVGNLPLVQDKLALRASAYYFEDSGFYRNRAGSDAAFQTQMARFGAEEFAIDEENAGASRFKGGRVAALFQATEDLRFTASYLTQKTERDGMAGTTTDQFDHKLLQVAPEHSMRGESGMANDTNIDIANAVVEYDLGWGEVLGSYSYVSSGTEKQAPLGAFRLDVPMSLSGPSDHRANIGEIRFISRLDGAWNFIAGLYTEELKDNLLFDYVWHGDPATNTIAAGQRNMGSYHDRQKLTQDAAFSEVSWEVTNGLTLTGGVRVFEYERSRKNDSVGALFGRGNSFDVANKEDGESWRANLSYKVAEDALVYAGWSQGFRLGQVQPGLPAGACDVNNDGIVDGTAISLTSATNLKPDTIDSYEIGGKFALFDRRLTLETAIFRMEWTDIPVVVTLPRDSGVSVACSALSAHSANVGLARSDGVEIQATFRATDEMRISIGGSWIDAKLMNDVPTQRAVAGDTLPGTPEYNANFSFEYDLLLAGLEPSFRTDVVYIDTFWSGFGQLPEREAGGYVKVDASIRVPIRSATLDIYVRNLTNDDAVVDSTAFLRARLRPRTVGVQLSYNFGR